MWLRYKWYVWFTPRNRRQPTTHPMQHILQYKTTNKKRN